MRREKEQNKTEREGEIEIKKELVSVCFRVLPCALHWEKGGRVVKPRLRIYDIELEVRRADPEVGANKIWWPGTS